MSAATEDLLRTLTALRKIVDELGSVQLGTGMDRSVNSLCLNGAHVTAFAALEDFLRRRVLEVIRWLGKSDVKFNDFPQALKKFLLEETIKGINFSLQRTDESERVSFLQLEGLLMDSTINSAVKFEPSDYCFGKSQSNLSKAQIGDFISAMMIKDGLTSLTTVGVAAGLGMLGPPDRIFVRLAINRHKAAHAFGSDYKINDFIDDMNTGLPLFAFVFDTCISQCAYEIKKSVAEGRKFNYFNSDDITLRRFEFNTRTSKWNEFRGLNFVQELAKGGLQKRVQKFKKDNLAVGETIFIRGGNGGVESWVQPF